MTVCIVLLLCGALALALFLREKLRGPTLRAAIWKSVTSALFVALAVSAWVHAAAGGTLPILGAFVVPGLVFGLMGDIWLDLKFVYPHDDAPLTYAGFATFGVGHILYQLGLLFQYYIHGRPGWVLVPMGLALLLTVGNVALEKPMKLRFGTMKPVVLAYGFLLFLSVLLSGSLALLHQWKETALNLFFAGAVLFALSDLVLSGTYFGEGKDRPVDIGLNYLT
jgi:hypothetical protein